MEAEELVRAGRLAEALELLQQRVRQAPQDAKLRVFLFQLLSVLGDWERALTQLNVAAELDVKNLLMARVCEPALQSEALRAEVFGGQRSPVVFGQPEEWVAWMVQANQLSAQGKYQAADELRGRALEAAPAVPGKINDAPFEWLSDADPRLGPILEMIVQGRYCWVPMACIRELRLEPPADLRDVVWMPATIIWTNGGEAAGLIPTRYQGSEAHPDSAIRLARKTDWVRAGTDFFTGLGQRMLATDQGEYALMEVRQVTFAPAPAAAPAGEAPHA